MKLKLKKVKYNSLLKDFTGLSKHLFHFKFPPSTLLMYEIIKIKGIRRERLWYQLLQGEVSLNLQ